MSVRARSDRQSLANVTFRCRPIPFARTAFRANAEAVSDDEHANHQFGSDGGTSGMAVVVRQVLAQLAQVEEAVDAAQQMILRDVAFKIEGIEQRRLSASWLSHHHCTPA